MAWEQRETVLGGVSVSIQPGFPLDPSALDPDHLPLGQMEKNKTKHQFNFGVYELQEQTRLLSASTRSCVHCRLRVS